MTRTKRIFRRDIGRRDFLAAAGAAGLAIGLAGSLRAAEAPKRGGTLRQILRGGSTTDTLDGAVLIDTHAINTSFQVRNTLTEITPTGDLAGDLAESWETEPGAKKWVVKLRKGITFHNGKSLTPQDVIYSLNHHRGKDSKSGGAPAVAGIEDINADGPETLVFTLKDGSVDFPYLLADYHLIIAPDGTTDWDKGVGTGPFVLESYEPGTRSLTKRNPNYHKEGLPYFDAVESLNAADGAARVNALRSGSVDVAEDPGLLHLDLLARVPGIRIIEAESGTHYSLPMRTDMAPFDNNDVRLALKYGIDREAMLRVILKGHGSIGNDQPIARGMRYYDATLEQRVYDPDKAKFHLKKAGLDKLSVTLSASQIYPGAVDLATLYKEQAKAADIDIAIEQMSVDTYWSEGWMKKPWSMVFWYGRATADWMFSTVYAAGSSWNDTYWNNERFNKVLVEARVELDETKRAAMYAELQRIVRDDGGAVIPLFSNLSAAVTDKVGVPDVVGGDTPMDGQRNAERWYFV